MEVSKNKKHIVVFLLLMIFFVGVARATESRVETLGGQGLYLMDDTNIFSNPALLSNHRNMLRFHLGGVDDFVESSSVTGKAVITRDLHVYGGGTMAIGRALTVGIFVGRNPSYEMGGISDVGSGIVDLTTGIDLDGDGNDDIPGTFFFPFEVYGLRGAVDWENPLDVILSYQVGHMAFGISYYLANGKAGWENEFYAPGVTEEMEVGATLHGIKFGALYRSARMRPITMWMQWDPYSIVSEYELDDEADIIEKRCKTTLSGRKFVFGARMHYNLSDTLTVVPAIEWENTSGEVELDDVPDTDVVFDVLNFTEEDLGIGFEVNSFITGVSLQYKTDRIFAIGSLCLLWSEAETTVNIADTGYETVSADKIFSAPVAALGIEFHAKKWLMLRGGVNTTTVWATETVEYNEHDVDVEGELVVEDSGLVTVQETTATIGVGLLFGNLTIDTALGNKFLAGEGGASEGGIGPNLFSHLDVKYVF